MKIPEPVIKYIGPKGDYSSKVLYSTVEECYEYCRDKIELGIDIETTRKYRLNTYRNENIYQPGLDPYLSSVVMLQIGDTEQIYVIDTRTTDINILKKLFIDKRLWVGHNLKFEAKHLYYNYKFIFNTIWDTMIVEMNLTNGYGWTPINKEGLKYSLEALSGRYLGIKAVQNYDLFTQPEEDVEDQIYIDKSTRMGFLTIGDKPFTEKQILYGSDDILYPMLIRQLQKKGTASYNPLELHKLENKFTLVLADMELRGMAFNKDKWLETYNTQKEVYKNRLHKLNTYVELNYQQFCKPADLFNPYPTCNIEWSSSKQVIKLFRHLEICPQEKSKQTGRVEYTVGAKALVKLLSNKYKEYYNEDTETEIESKQDLILNYLLMKVSEQACTTFGEDWLKYVHPITGRVHSSYKQILHTGRISSNKPNLQNIPADDMYRSAFIAEPGNMLINCDYSSQEARVVADICGDEAMIKFFNEGHPIHGNDYHSFTATKLFSVMRNQPDLILNKKDNPKERTQAKTISFKIIYGGAATTLKDDLGVSEEEAQVFIDSYLDAFPRLRKFFEDAHKNAIEKGYIEIDSVTQRRYWEAEWNTMQELNDKIWALYPEDYRKLSKEEKERVKEKINKEHPELKQWWKEYFIIKGGLERCSQNFPVQGTSAAQSKTAGIILRNKIQQKGWKDQVFITNIIHDEFLIECPVEIAEECRKDVEDAMIEGAEIFCKKVKMTAEAKIVSYWNH